MDNLEFNDWCWLANDDRGRRRNDNGRRSRCRDEDLFDLDNFFGLLPANDFFLNCDGRWRLARHHDPHFFLDGHWVLCDIDRNFLDNDLWGGLVKIAPSEVVKFR